jgi:hypothetical protein
MEALIKMVASVIGAVFSLALFFALLFAFVNAIAKTASKSVLGPIHEKLDRLLAMQEEANRVPKA